ncbi:S41 family peptidase [Hyphomonas sp.]|uniref:S41 family peptidase n=1 Tax=Hyphomonas sp. TaxID=87 RepID=UPI003F71B7FB
MLNSAITATLIATVLALVGCVAHSQVQREHAGWSRTELEADLDTWLDWTRSTHPAFELAVEQDTFGRQVDRVRAQLRDEMGVSEVWHTFAQLNPYLDDAHMGLDLPAAVGGSEIWRVEIEDARAYIPAGNPDEEREEIIAVNGASVSDMIVRTLPLLRGESDSLRSRILELRFRELLALHLDGALPVEIRLQGTDGTERFVAHVSSTVGASETAPFDMLLVKSTAVMRIDTFERDYEAAFTAFLEESFERIESARATRLVIDLRGNGGGAHELSDRLLGYLTSERYTPMSAVRARVTEDNMGLIPGGEPGAVVAMPFAQWVEPVSPMGHLFDGEVIILVGPATYSQAIVFATIIQDFQLGSVAGEKTEGKANQTAQVQHFALPRTGFHVRAPLYVLTRASGEESGAGVMPDIVWSNADDRSFEWIVENLDRSSGEAVSTESSLRQ